MATSIPIAGNIYFFFHKQFLKYFVLFAVRSSSGISIVFGPPSYGNLPEFDPIQSKSCRTMLFSPDGKYFAFVNGQLYVYF